MKRDIYRDKEYFDSEIDRKVGRKSFDFYKGRYIDDARFPPDEHGFKALDAIETGMINLFFTSFTMDYCTGTSLDDMYAEYIEEGLDRYCYLVDELAKGHPQEWVFPLNAFENRDKKLSNPTPYRYHSIYTWLSWFLCMGGSEEKIAKIVPYLCVAGEDRIIDVLLSRYQPDREIAPSSCAPKTFGLLEKVLDASDKERVDLLEEYLEHWLTYMSTLEFNSLGITSNSSAEGYLRHARDINADKQEGNFKGLWAWEVALMVKFYDLDDSRFKDNPFYPADFANYTRV